jgi:hypothetical protein
VVISPSQTKLPLAPKADFHQIVGKCEESRKASRACKAFVASYAVGWLDAATGSPKVSYLLMAGTSLLISCIVTLAVGVEQVQAAETERLASRPPLHAGGPS